MKNIKYKIVAYITIFALALNFTSCSDNLDQVSKGDMSEEEVIAKLSRLELLVKGMYVKYRNTKQGREGITFSALGTDESQQGTWQMKEAPTQPGMDYYNGLLSSTSGEMAAIWDKKCTPVYTAALAIAGLQVNTEDPDKVKTLLGEASFFRGMLMYELSMLWGEIPIWDKTREGELGYKRQPLKDVWEYIINDFKVASNNLPEKWTDDPKRITSGAALAMLGKAYMSAPEETGLRDFSLAKDAFEKIINRYQLVANYEDLFAYDKPFSSESIFELQFNNIWPDCNYWQFDLGSRVANTWFSQGCSFSGYDIALPTKYGYSTVTEGGVWEDGDLRRDVSIRYDFTYDGVTPDDSQTAWLTDELDPHIKKFEDPRTDKNNGNIANMWNSGKNLSLIRLADVILLYAECMNELGQTSDAVTIVNDKVRARAWGGTLPADKKWGAMTQAQFRDNIMDERIRELCFEGWRRYDLIRTGSFVKLIKERNKWAKESGTIQDFHMRYPIPDSEIKNNEDMTEADQNTGYR